jgi:CubicO group peptidase (beta-lactamase class C family)
MKKEISGLKIFTVIIVFLLSVAVFRFNKSLRVPSIFDGKFYNTLEIKTSTNKISLPKKIVSIPDLQYWADSISYAENLYTDIFLKNSNTTSFLIVKDGKIIFERYLNGVKEGDITQIFSVTKVFITALLGAAIQDKIIDDVHLPVSYFYNNLKNPLYDSLELYHLCQMTSGLNYDEYGKLLQTISFYYNRDLKSAIENAKFTYKPGKVFKYKSIDTQILGDCISKALKHKSFIEYLHEKIWQPLGMQDTAFFTVDSRLTRIPKYYGGLNVSARDLAKFGVMMANNGIFNGKQIVPKYWLNQCDDENMRSNSDERYCFAWYYSVDDSLSNVYYAAGFNGQTMLINETKKVVIIRLGIDKGNVYWYPILKKLSEIV